MTDAAEPGNRKQIIMDAVEAYHGPLSLFAAKMLGNAEAGRDVAQETFLRLCSQDLARLTSLKAWLFQVCRNLALDALRRGKKMTTLGEQTADRASPEPDPAEALARAESASTALRLLDSLPANQREVIRLKFQNGLSYREIGEITNQTATNVGFLIHTGMKRLRQQMAGELAASAK